MQKRYIPITTITIILIIIAFAGYMKNTPAQENPVKLLFDTKGGKVIFSHISHSRDYNLSCQECHHEKENISSQPTKCSKCHPAEFDKQFKQEHRNWFKEDELCLRCHHLQFKDTNFDHDAHSEEFTSECQECHHGPDIEEEPENCANCHESNTASNTENDQPNLKDALHTRCNDCHAEMYEQGLQGCESCHNFQKASPPYSVCSTCHYENKDNLIPTKLNAMHSGCMDCHKEKQKGPFSKQDCHKCHIK